jgi:hypothetical protein
LTFLFLHAKRAVVARRPAPIALSGIVAVQAGIYGYEYFVNS